MVTRELAVGSVGVWRQVKHLLVLECLILRRECDSGDASDDRGSGEARHALLGLKRAAENHRRHLKSSAAAS